jgi:hypothetical protein
MGDKPEIKTGGFKQGYKSKTASEKAKETMLMLTEQFPLALSECKTIEDVATAAINIDLQNNSSDSFTKFVLAAMGL